MPLAEGSTLVGIPEVTASQESHTQLAGQLPCPHCPEWLPTGEERVLWVQLRWDAAAHTSSRLPSTWPTRGRSTGLALNNTSQPHGHAHWPPHSTLLSRKSPSHLVTLQSTVPCTFAYSLSLLVNREMDPKAACSSLSTPGLGPCPQ